MNLKMYSAVQLNLCINSRSSITIPIPMEGMEHFNHHHPLILSKYDHSPPDAHCSFCSDPILLNTNFYHCIKSVATQDSTCTRFLLHETCAHLPMFIQHPLHAEHVLTLDSSHGMRCKTCDNYGEKWFYTCNECWRFAACIRCAFLECELNHPSHSHALTLLPVKATLRTCTACGTEGINDFSYLCKTCLFWIHGSCASAPTSLIREDHASDHPLVLAYSLPYEYRKFGGVSCYLCGSTVKYRYWLYYCAGCRYFAHVRCALSAAESGKNDDEGDVEGSNSVHFPISDDEPYLLYQLIQQFAKKFSISTDEKSGKADIISQCRSGHSLILFDDINSKSVVETITSDKRICDGCVQPLLSPPDPFYGCLDCNFFLHSVCAAELPREIQHPENELTTLTRCYQTSKPFNFYICGVCDKYCNGILYSDESNGYRVDIVCAALPSKIKHDSHKHTLHHRSPGRFRSCGGCSLYINSGHSFGCNICDYYIHIKCALKRGTLKHRWDEHRLSLMYRPVKGHPHAFNCELCSEDINPNGWFYHCHKCDTSFHSLCVDRDEFSNIKYGGILKDDNLHEHGIELCGTRQKFKCAKCGTIRADFCIWDPFKPSFYSWKPLLKCVSCKFFVCMTCIISHYGSLEPRHSWMDPVDIDENIFRGRLFRLRETKRNALRERERKWNARRETSIEEKNDPFSLLDFDSEMESTMNTQFSEW